MPNVKKIRGLTLPGTPWATSACCGRPLPFTFNPTWKTAREWFPIHMPASGNVSYKIAVSLHHTSTLIPLQQPLELIADSVLRSAIGSRLGYVKYAWTEKDKNQLLATTLSFLKASLNQAGRQTTSLSMVNNPYDRITSANTSSKTLQSWQQALDGSTKHARSHPLSRTRNPARTHIHIHTKNL